MLELVSLIIIMANPDERFRGDKEDNEGIPLEASDPIRKKPRKEVDEAPLFRSNHPEVCDEEFEYTRTVDSVPGKGFWEPYVFKVHRKACITGVLVAIFDGHGDSFHEMELLGYGQMLVVDQCILHIIPYDKDGSASAWPYYARLITTEHVFIFNSFGIACLPPNIVEQCTVPVKTVLMMSNERGPMLPFLPSMPTNLGENSYKYKLNADKLLGIKNLLRHDKMKSEQLFGSLDIMDNEKAKAAISANLLKSQLGMTMLQPKTLPMLVGLIHQRNFVQVADVSKTISGLHFMYFEEPNTKPLYHKRIRDNLLSFVAVLRQIVGGDADRYWASMFGPLTDLLSSREPNCMENMLPQLVMDACSEALVKWSLMMSAEANRGLSDEELMNKGLSALHIDINVLSLQALTEHRERAEKTERRMTAAAAAIAAGRGW